MVTIDEKVKNLEKNLSKSLINLIRNNENNSLIKIKNEI